jgi:hypothetical protein
MNDYRFYWVNKNPALSTSQKNMRHKRKLIGKRSKQGTIPLKKAEEPNE